MSDPEVDLEKNLNKIFRDLIQTIGITWTSDLEKLKSDLETVVHNITHLEVELKIEDEIKPIRKTELNLITGDITVIFPKGTKKDEIEIEKINTAAIKMAREELQERIDKLLKFIEILIGVISPTGSLKSLFDTINEVIKKLDTP